MVARLEGSGRQLNQNAHDFQIEGPGVNLSDRGHHITEPECLDHHQFELLGLLPVPVEEVEQILLRSDRTLETSERIVGEGLRQAAVGREELAGGGRESFTQSGGLGGDVVGTPDHERVSILHCPVGKPGQNRHRLIPDDLQGPSDDHLLHVLGHITGREAPVYVLVACQRAELVDAGLDVVPGHLLPGADRFQIDHLDDGPVRLQHPAGHRHPKFDLGL